MLSGRAKTTISIDADGPVTLGAPVTITVAAFDRTGDPADTEVVASVSDPFGWPAERTIAHDGPGVYRVVIDTPTVGEYSWKVTAGITTAIGVLTAV